MTDTSPHKTAWTTPHLFDLVASLDDVAISLKIGEIADGSVGSHLS